MLFARALPCLASTLLLVPLTSLPAASVTLSPTRDSSIYSDLTDNSSGAGRFIIAGVTKRVDVRRGLVAFDTASALPAGSVVNSVQLTLTIAKVPDELQVGAIHSVHRLQADWGAAGSSGTGTGTPAQAGDATWTQNFFGTSSWATAGGDFVSSESASAPAAPLVNETVIFTGPGLVDDVQLWVDNPLANFGWIVRGNETLTANARAYYSSDNSATALWPALLIDYTPVPEPAAVAGLGGVLAAGMVLLRRFS